MGEHDALHFPSGEDARPEFARLRIADAGVDNNHPIVLLEEPEVDVVELKRQRHGEPVHAARDFDRRARRGNFGKGILEGHSARIDCKIAWKPNAPNSRSASSRVNSTSRRAQSASTKTRACSHRGATASGVSTRL